MDVNWWDRDDILGEFYADDDWYFFNEGDINDLYLLEGDMFLADDGKLYELIDDFADCLYEDTVSCDPNNSDNVAAEGFTDVWAEIELPEDGSGFRMEPLIKDEEFYGAYGDGRCYGWTETTSPDFYGSFTFGYLDITCHNDRVWECVDDEGACALIANEPGTEAADEVWALTTYAAGTIYEEADWLALVKPIMECVYFPDEENFPFFAGDVVCDPMFPEYAAWSCLDPVACS